MVKESDYTIVNRFGAEYRGVVQYYLLAHDVHRLHRLRWIMETSMIKTLQAPLLGVEDGGPLQGQDPHSVRSADLLRGTDRARREQPAGRTVRRCSPQAAKESGPVGPYFPCPRLSDEGAGQATPSGRMRAVSAGGCGR
ncbi:hypothetical protein OG762_50110 (plasmid) [Streptomyces sp. NBC_01136]|nr:hypothetical protein OG762_50110 [Streptomyces sp. NBC_01136]